MKVQIIGFIILAAILSTLFFITEGTNFQTVEQEQPIAPVSNKDDAAFKTLTIN